MRQDSAFLDQIKTCARLSRRFARAKFFLTQGSTSSIETPSGLLIGSSHLPIKPSVICVIIEYYNYLICFMNRILTWFFRCLFDPL